MSITQVHRREFRIHGQNFPAWAVFNNALADWSGRHGGKAEQPLDEDLQAKRAISTSAY